MAAGAAALSAEWTSTPTLRPLLASAAMRDAVLLVEREAPMRDHLSRQLADDGFAVFAADRPPRRSSLSRRSVPTSCSSTRSCPTPGFDVCGRLRAGEPGRAWNRDVPVIMVSARGDPPTGCGFARGADDYVVRPFVYEELVARMRAVLRRAARPQHPRLAVRTSRSTSPPASSGSPAPPWALGEGVRPPGRARRGPRSVYRKEELLRDVWGFRSLGRTRTLDSHASRLRRKLKQNGEAAYVVNVWGVGYRLVAAA